MGIMNSEIEFPQLWKEKLFSLSDLYLTRTPEESDPSDIVSRTFPSLIVNLQNKEA